jgi:tetratricopeptide (TPR) repeat protein
MPAKTTPQSSQRSSSSLTAVKRRAFIFITLALPVVILMFMEIILRVVHYGPDLSLFTTEVFNGRTYHIMNPSVKNRYFYRVKFMPSTSPDYFLVPKPQGTYRVFCLGASTTVGFPYYFNVSFSTALRERLRRIFPDRKIEVINIGMTATNSYTSLDMAREAVAYEPDLFILYDGHNEFYGALGASSREGFGGSRFISHLYLKLIHVRTFLLLRDAYAAITNLLSPDHQVDPSLTMMEKLAQGRYIALGSKEYNDCLSSFRANLEDLRDLCLKKNIPLIVGTQVSNLRDRAPFVSAEFPSALPGERMAFQQSLNAGLAHLMNNNPDAALAAFRNAERMHPGHAETAYHVARSLDALGMKRDAEKAYIRARDLDELRFRTSTDFNEVLKTLDNGSLIACADMERAFRDESPDSLIGKELILEHLHPTVRGYFVLAREYARLMRARGLFAPSSEWAARDTIPEQTHWEQRTVTELDERIAQRRTEVLTSSWPFKEGESAVEAVPRSDTLALIADQVARARIYWHQAHYEAIQYYETRRDTRHIEREYRTIISQLPIVEVTPYLRLARLLLDQGRMAEVRTTLEASLDVQPTILAYRALGDIALNSKNFSQAALHYEKTFTFPQTPPEQAENGYLLALANFRAGNRDQALIRVTAALKAKPDYRPAVELLRVINAR